MGGLFVGEVVLAEELGEAALFVAYAGGEKAVEEKGKQTEGERVEEQELRAEGPVEEAEVARVPEVGVDAVCDEDVAVFSLPLDHVGEVLAGCFHGQRSRVLSEERDKQAEELYREVSRVFLPSRRQPQLEQTFGEGCCVCEVVERGVIEDEGGRVDAGGLVGRGREVLEKVERGDEGDVERQVDEGGEERAAEGQRE